MTIPWLTGPFVGPVAPAVGRLVDATSRVYEITVRVAVYSAAHWFVVGVAIGVVTSAVLVTINLRRAQE